MNNILEIEKLRKEFKGFRLDNISFNLPRGFIMGFIGPNGAGKTTTIKLIMNLLHRDGGDIRVFGQDSLEHERAIKERIGFVYDESFFFESLNAGEIGYLMSHFYRSWDRAVFQRYLGDYELPVRKKIKEFSRGMKMKFSLAIALSHNAELIIMDEPTSGLDPVFRRKFLDTLGEVIQDERKGILLSSHITSDLERIADYITFISRGKILFSDNKDKLLERYFIVQGSKADLKPELESRLMGLHTASYGFEGLTDNIESVRPMLSDQCIIEKANLEQVMVSHVQDEKRNN